MKSELPIASYVGEFENPVMGTVALHDVEGRFTYGRTREQTLELVVESEGGNQFLGRHLDANEDFRTGKVDVEFKVSDGQVTGMRDFSEGVPIEFTRLGSASVATEVIAEPEGDYRVKTRKPPPSEG